MRKHYLDNIRWGTVVIVVLYHVVYMYNAEGIIGVVGKITKLKVQYYDVFQYIVYPWFMELLFLVSGISARYSLEKHTHKEFLRGRTRRLLVPCTVGLVCFQFLQGYVNVSLGGLFERNPNLPLPAKLFISVLSGIGVLWYIQLLWVFSLLLVLIRNVEKDRLWSIVGKAGLTVLVSLTVPVWCAAQVLNTPIILVYRLGLYFFVFLLGYYVFSHDEVIEVLKQWFLPLLFVAAALGAAFCICFFGQNYADAPVNRSALFTSYGWFACLAILGGAAKYADISNGFTEWMRLRSFGLYLFHYLGISAVGLFVAKPGLLPAPAIYLLSLAAGFGSGYLLGAVISKLPFFRWAVMGIGNGDEKGSR